MAVLTADAQISAKSRVEVLSYPMADNVKIYKGSIVCADTSGYANVGANTAAFVCLGVADEQRDNTLSGHTAGGKRIRVQSDRIFTLPTTSATQASVGQPVYVTDSGSVGFTASNNVRVGVCVAYTSATSIDVYIPTPTFDQLSNVRTNVGNSTADTYGATIAIDATKTFHTIAASFTTSAAATINAAAVGGVGDLLVIETATDASGTCTITFGTNLHSTGTQATTLSKFSTITFVSDGTRWVEQSRTTAAT